MTQTHHESPREEESQSVEEIAVNLFGWLWSSHHFFLCSILVSDSIIFLVHNHGHYLCAFLHVRTEHCLEVFAADHQDGLVGVHLPPLHLKADVAKEWVVHQVAKVLTQGIRWSISYTYRQDRYAGIEKTLTIGESLCLVYKICSCSYTVP